MEGLDHYAEHGYLRLGRMIDEPVLERLRARADDIMLGRVQYPGLFFQLNDGEYGKGFEGPSLAYRKLEKLELDPEFRALINDPIYERIARAALPEAKTIAIYRAVLFTKPIRGGSAIPWHQDGGRMWGLDRDPTLQVWLALDDAPEDAGCLEVLPGSHKLGLASPLGGVVPEAKAIEAEGRGVKLPARAGELILVHNYLWHRSDTNTSDRPRRALSVCYIDGATRCLRTRRAPRKFVEVFQRSQSPAPERLDTIVGPG